jgi:hypothetical protein
MLNIATLIQRELLKRKKTLGIATSFKKITAFTTVKTTPKYNFLKGFALIAACLFMLSSCAPKVSRPVFRAPNKVAEFDSLLANLEANNYDFDDYESMPDLYWDDIPHLLEYAESDLPLTFFPRNPASSYAQHQAYMGVVALWMIESIRRDDAMRSASDIQPFPSLNPILGDRRDAAPNLEPDSFIELRNAAEAYRRWWDMYPLIGIDSLKKIDPLVSVGMKWN